MAKYGIKDIAAMLAAKKGMDAADAEKYVETFFALVSESLIPDKVVKVKGFGTFKLVEVRDRESVDINTGERVVIDGHSKISFTPDNTLKELVNKPFSQFETVVLNEGVDFDKLTLEDIAEESNEESDEFADNPSEAVEEKTADNEDEANGAGEPQSLITEALSQAKEELPPIVEEDTAEAEEATEQIEQIESIGQIGQVEPIEQIEDCHPTREAVEPKEPVEWAESDEPIEPTHVRCKSSYVKKALYAVATVVLLVVIFFGGVYFGKQSNRAIKETIPERPIVKVAKKAAVRQVAKKEKQHVDTAAIQDSLRKVAEAKSIEQERQEVKKEEPEEKGSLDNARRMVKTGAYTIDGPDKTITVKPGQTLESISRLYLGEGMECYIQVYNNKLELREGEKVNIPKLKLKKKATNKKVS